MIVPQNRLLLWFALTAMPLALFSAVNPDAAPAAGAAFAAFLLIAAADALMAARGLKGISARLPDVVRLSRGRDGHVPIDISNKTAVARRIRIGIPFPEEVEAPETEKLVLLPRGAELSRTEWPCLPRERGSHAIDRVFLEARSPIGFWASRAAADTPCELRVYPNLLTERRAAPALFLKRGAFGMHAQRQAGKGRDFEKLREYIPGDGYDEIHWKATAKRGRPVTKVYQIERTQEVYVLIDASRLSARVQANDPAASSSAITTLDRYVTAGLVLSLAAQGQGDLYGLLTFTDRVETFVRARNGKEHFAVCREALYALKPKIVTPDFDEAISFVRLRLRKRALLVILTALDDPMIAEGFLRAVRLICRQHLIFVNVLPPPGVEPLFTRREVQSVDEIYERIGGHTRWHETLQLERVLKRSGIRFALLENELLSAQLVSQYMQVKQRGAPLIIDFQKFAEEERPRWIELDSMLRRIESDPRAKLRMEEVKRLHYLYERASAALGKVMTFSSEPEVRGHLESLVARAYGELHEVREPGKRVRLWSWLFHTWPRTFRRHSRAFQLSVAVTLAGCALGWLAVELDPDAKQIILPFSHLIGDPSERVKEEEKAQVDRLEGAKTTFSAFLMNNNIRVSIFAMALGMTWGIGTIIVLFYNGVILGAVVFDYIRAGEASFLLGWLLPHGAIEIPAIIIAGQAGLVLAHALLGRGSSDPLEARLREAAGEVMTLIFGVAILLVWAGIVEAFLSQYHEPVIPYSLKIGFGCVELVLLAVFLAFAGRGPEKIAA